MSLKFKPDHDSAAQEYQRAGVCFRNAKKWSQSADAYVKAAACHEECQTFFHAAKCKVPPPLPTPPLPTPPHPSTPLHTTPHPSPRPPLHTQVYPPHGNTAETLRDGGWMLGNA